MSQAVIHRDVDGWLLTKDGTQLSHVSLDPRVMKFPYMKMIGEIIDAMREGPLNVLHIGGGAFTIARYIGATRPGSVNTVAEPDEQVLMLSEERLPWPQEYKIFPLAITGRRLLETTSDNSRDLVVLDAFYGFNTPEDLRSPEAFEEMRRVLKPGGMLICNLIIDVDQIIETAGEVFGAAMIFGIGEPSPFNNVVVALSKNEER